MGVTHLKNLAASSKIKSGIDKLTKYTSKSDSDRKGSGLALTCFRPKTSRVRSVLHKLWFDDPPSWIDRSKGEEQNLTSGVVGGDRNQKIRMSTFNPKSGYSDRDSPATIDGRGGQGEDHKTEESRSGLVPSPVEREIGRNMWKRKILKTTLLATKMSSVKACFWSFRFSL